ncbi:MAG: choice-of-anchor D domain-containing protein [Pirellulaceae bacterium]|nr:choice-of-anchor D domain-containing protein [Pirellulaceae bacterium]
MRRSPSRAPVRRCTHNRQAEKRRKSQVERLEPRYLMTASPGADDEALFSGNGSVCSCPVCTGVGLSDIPSEVDESSGPAESNPLSSLPQLSSNPGATAKLFLDFNGHFQASWGSWSNVTTPVFDTDGDATTFSSGELSTIEQIWARVAEDFAPFNIDVTTIDPGSLANKVVAHIAIGGSASDWYGSSAGGVAYVGGFYNSAPNVGYVFENNLGNGNAKYVAEAASHEAGHLFGLQHQALWSGSTLVQSYHQGSDGWAPIMGVGYYQERSTWHNGTTSAGPTAYQDDLSILSNSNNGFGWRADDYGSTIATASTLPISGTSVNLSGLVGNNEQDVWSFTTAGGALNFSLNVADYGPNLDSVLELLDAAGNAIVTANPTTSLGASIATTVGAGTFYLVARSSGGYGNMGQYSITGTVPAAAASPEIGISVSGANVADGGTVNFGSTTVGTTVSRTFTVTNSGSATLNLTNLNPAAIPAGFTLTSNLGSTSLAAGASTTFTIRYDASQPGAAGGTFSLLSNDSDEGSFEITLSATATTPEITLRLGTDNITDGQTINFGSATVGTSVTRTFTVINDGTTTLSLTTLNGGSFPAGFSLVSNLGSTSLAPGQSTTFQIRFQPSAAGSFSGSIALLNNDADESPFDLILQGTGQVATADITVLVGTTELASGGTVDFGAVAVGNAVQRTITIRNDGDGPLTLTAIDPAALPAGFSLVSNLGSTSLAAGEATSFTIQLDAVAAGSFTGSLAIISSDPDESPFTIQLSGQAQAGTTVVTQVLDDGSTGHSVSGSWNRTTGNGYGSDVLTAKKGTGSITSTWSFTSLPSGTYKIWATWTKAKSNASNAPFQLYNGDELVSSTSVNQRNAPPSTIDGTDWKYLGVVTVTGGVLKVELNNKANGNVMADAIRIQSTTELVAPQMELSLGEDSLASGSTIDFGIHPLGGTSTRTITVTNEGSAVLNLAPISAGQLPAGFTLVENLGKTSLAAGESTTFSLSLETDAAGEFSGTLSLVSDDPNTKQFKFKLRGAAYDPADFDKTVDNGNTGSKFSSSWKRVTGKGHQSDIHTVSKGTGSRWATWSFSGLPDGHYAVYTTWTKTSTNASNAPLTVTAGGQTLLSTTVNQRLSPSGLSADGVNWKQVGTVEITGGSAVIRMTNKANGKVVADAMRLELIPEGLPVAALAAAPQGGASAQVANSTPYAFVLASTASGARAVEESPSPACEPVDNASGDAASDFVWSQPEDVLAEQQLLDDVLDLLDELHGQEGDQDDWLGLVGLLEEQTGALTGTSV